MELAIFIGVVLQLLHVSFAQHVPPGVNPQRYQQQQQYQQQGQYQQQQQQQQFQQVPVQQQQQQQIPIQQQQQQVPLQQAQPVHVHQVPVQQQHPNPVQQQPHHGGHQSRRSGQLLDTSHIAEEKDHIAEHADVPIDTSKMSEQELQFHYFKMHDADNNNKLDGCELIKSLIHWHEQEGREHIQHQASGRIFKDDELVTLIDPILITDDSNKDGYIDYPEFITAQQKVAPSSPTKS